ncbi:hypothetical protein Psed_6391 [Pseudonocardia dioxanivorans CB1190]|uniref:Uncharacterized protein n=1 Tax=Pseudonocardia dioxanivorans (strain ATCC 55486 / DSM 44775 / JCM 13855 / CB1190) TaxID=675635 RepID=F4CS43_PSEUX|nr:hypothetical protein Psed_6391 [Pseudonocardia dioxanivorans CB1190]
MGVRLQCLFGRYEQAGAWRIDIDAAVARSPHTASTKRASGSPSPTLPSARDEARA